MELPSKTKETVKVSWDRLLIDEIKQIISERD